jgi:HK97 family phage major capsid protein
MRTLVQYEYLDKDALLSGVMEWIVKESPILQVLPFIPIQGNSYKYNVELTLPTSNWMTVGEAITSTDGTVEQRSTDIYTLIHNCLTDKSVIALNSTQNPETIDIEAGAKSMAHEFEKTFILGQTTTTSSTKQFKGLMRIIAEMESATTTDIDGINNSQAVPNHATSGAPTQANMDILMDAIKPGGPNVLLMSRGARRALNVVQRASGSTIVMVEIGNFGLKVPSYDGIPIAISDFIPENMYDANGSSVTAIASYDQSVARATNYKNTVIFALKYGDQDVCGLQAGQMLHERETFVEGYNAIVNRFTWYVGAACFKKYSIAGLFNVLV